MKNSFVYEYGKSTCGIIRISCTFITGGRSDKRSQPQEGREDGILSKFFEC